MEQVNFGYSLKNIPIPEEKVYLQMLVNSTEKVMRSIRWKVLHFLNPQKPSKKETFGFNSTKPAPSVPELKEFENALAEIIKEVKFTKETNDFQNKIKKDCKDIKSESKIFAAADKTSNYYKTDPEDYLKLLEKNITKDYKKTEDKIVTNIEAGDIKLTKKLDIDDRVFETTKRQAFITIKDHKPNFRNNIKTRLLNPTKPELGKVSKKILEAKIQILKKKTGFNQWKNNTSMLNWYIKQRQKHKLTFIQFDVDDFYGSIGEELLNDAIDWANKYVDITEDERIFFLTVKEINPLP